ncbi:MAG TPA: redoxin family protein, partial [Candidatus Paceibacterota bacterium]|nr:redoxin family protein [Candidatus Paceibacterota bacterium]
LKVHPTGSGGAGHAINIGSINSTTPAMGSANGTSSVLSLSVQTALAQIAAADKAAGDQPAIEIVDPTGFINTSSTFTLSSLIGHDVILLDFWTYSCINCVRTIPYLNAWYAKYNGLGFVVVGIHTPEFDFEKNITNVQNAVQEYGIHYPVILDSNYGTWDAYNNLYWPNEYLIDMAGYIVHNQVGEGNYAESEAEIQKLLVQRAQVLGLNPAAIPTSTVNITAPDLSEINSPETYFGAERNSYLANGTPQVNGQQTLTAPAANDVQLNELYLGGTWDFEDQYATNVNAGATVTYEYDAGNVYIVAAGAPNGTVVDVLQDGQPISAADAGTDVHNGKIVISGNKLYNLVKNADGGGIHTLQLIVESPGLQAYTFTFG